MTFKFPEGFKFQGLRRAMERLNPPAAPGTPRITRFEVIDVTQPSKIERCGVRTAWHNVIVEQSVQDDGRTLKIFVRPR